MLSSLPVEDMSYIAEDFPQLRQQGEAPHPSQKDSVPIRCKLFFLVPSDEEPECPCKVVSINVPRGMPVYRLRNFIRYAESALRGVYSDAKRLQIVFTQQEQETEAWELVLDLPMYGVTYV